jgi:hypothetical protein
VSQAVHFAKTDLWHSATASVKYPRTREQAFKPRDAVAPVSLIPNRRQSPFASGNVYAASRTTKIAAKLPARGVHVARSA